MSIHKYVSCQISRTHRSLLPCRRLSRLGQVGYHCLSMAMQGWILLYFHQGSFRISSIVARLSGLRLVIFKIKSFVLWSILGSWPCCHCAKRVPGSSSMTTSDNAVSSSVQYSSSMSARSSGGAGPNNESNLYSITCSGSVPSALSCSKSGWSNSAPVNVYKH